MAYRKTLQVAKQEVLLLDVVYCLPPMVVHVLASDPVEISSNGTDWSTLTDADSTGAETAALFIRNHASDPSLSVVIKTLR